MSRPCAGAFIAVLSIYILFPGGGLVLSAQTPEPSGGVETLPPAEGAAVDESAILLGEAGDVPDLAAGSSVFVAVRMVLVLALAALAVYGIVFFIKRMARPQESRDPYLKVLARVPLGGDSFAAVVSLGAKAWLVGGGSGGITLISGVEDQDTLEAMLLDDARRAAPAGNRLDFRSVFKRLGTPPGSQDSSNPGASHAGNLRRQRERLKGQ